MYKGFLDALAFLVVMIDTDSLSDSLTNRLGSTSDSSDPSDLFTQNGMSLKMEYHSKWNATQNGISLKMECYLKWNVTQNGMSLKMEFNLKWNVTKIECHSKLNVTQNGMSLKKMSLKMEYH